MTGFKNPLHGRTHLTKGSDPLPGVIVFNYNNDDGWFYLSTESTSSPNGQALYLVDQGGDGIKILAGAGGDLTLDSSGGSLLLSGADASLTSGGRLDIDATGLLDVTAGADATLTVTGDTTVVSHGGITLTAGTSGATSPDGVLQLNGYDHVELFCSIGDIDVLVSNAGSAGDRDMAVRLTGTLDTLFRVDSAGHIFMPHLPTSNPGTGDGQLWKNGQVVTVST